MRTPPRWSLFALAWSSLIAAAPAASYFVSPSGSDTAPGTEAQPFATVQFAVGRLAAGDVLQLRGGTYHETVTVSRSGTAAAPITIRAYPGETPVLAGAPSVNGPWSVYAGAIPRAPWPTQPVQVFCDGRLLNEARWPNTPLPADQRDHVNALTDDGSTNDISKAGLPDVDLTGGWLHVMAGQSWVGYDRKIATHDRATGKLGFLSPINQLNELIPRRNNRFFVFGKLELLDTPGEWWWDPAGRQLYVWTPDGASPNGRVEAGPAEVVLSISGQSHVILQGLAARGGWFNLQDCTACRVEDCHLYAPTWLRTFDGYAIWPTPLVGGIDLSGSGNVVQGGSVRLSGRSGVHLGGSDNTLRDMLVEDCGWNWTNNAPVDLSGSVRSLVEHCTIRHSAGAGLVLAPASRVLRNRVEAAALAFEDCGSINSWSMDGQNTEVAYNVVRGNHSRWGAGIYLDAGSRNFWIHDNDVDDVRWNGINITGPLLVEYNTFLGAQYEGLGIVPQSSTDGVDMSAGRLAHNLAAEPFPITVSFGQPLALVPEYASFAASTPLAPLGATAPRRVEITWSQLVQPGWSRREVALDLSIVNTIAFAFESPATAFSYTVSNLRLLPADATGDDRAVAVTAGAVQVSASGGATATLAAASATSWTVTGVNPYRGRNILSMTLPSQQTNLTAYRGIAFELVGTATRNYQFQGYQDVDNGAAAISGRGARLPPAAEIGAPATTVSRVAAVPTLPAFAWATFAAGTAGTYSPGVANPVGLTFSADGLPAWAAIDPATGVITGTPPASGPKIVQVTLRATNGVGSFSTGRVNLLVGRAGQDVRVVNLSSRAQVLAGNRVMVPGFVLEGAVARPFLVRAAGPALLAWGVAGTLADPRMTLWRRESTGDSTPVAENDDWSIGDSVAELTTTMTTVGAFAFASGSRDAALLGTLGSGVYTATVEGAGGGTGVALVELFDAGEGSGRVANLSTRAMIGTGDDLLIVGTVLSGGGSVRLLVRAVGPGLAVAGLKDELLADPEIRVFTGQRLLAENDDWETGNDAAEIRAVAQQVGAGPLAAGSKDAALVITLTEGSYSIHVAGKNGTTGIALAELYVVDR